MLFKKTYDNHLSISGVASGFQQFTRRLKKARFASLLPDEHPLLLNFAPGEVYHALIVANKAVGSYSTFSPLLEVRCAILWSLQANSTAYRP